MSGSASPDPKTVEFLKRLLQRTAERKVKWRPGESEEAFRASIGNHLVEIASLPGALGTRDYRIAVLDSEQRKVTEISSNAFSDHPTVRAMFRSIHEQALRTAMKADEVIDAIIADLEGR